MVHTRPKSKEVFICYKQDYTITTDTKQFLSHKYVNQVNQYSRQRYAGVLHNVYPPLKLIYANRVENMMDVISIQR